LAASLPNQFDNGITVNGNTSLATLLVTGSAVINGNLNVSGNLTFTATSYGNIIPSGTNYSLGNTSLPWFLSANQISVANGATIKGGIITDTLLVNSNVNSNGQLLVLNYGLAAPGGNAGIIINRGSSSNAIFRWSETNTWWEAGISGNVIQLVINDGNTYAISISGNANTATTALTSNNSTNFGGQPASYYANAGNLSTGTIPALRLTGTYAISISGNANTTNLATLATLANTALLANNSTNLNGQPASYYTNIVSLLGYTPANIIAPTFNGGSGYSSATFNMNSVSPIANSVAANGAVYIFQGNTTLGGSFISFVNNGRFGAQFGLDSNSKFSVGGWSFGNNSYQIWHAGNQGSGSGMDSDKLDGQYGSYYTNASNITTGTLPVGQLSGTYNINVSGSANNSTNLNGSPSSYFLNASNFNAGTIAAGLLPATMNPTTFVYGSGTSISTQGQIIANGVVLVNTLNIQDPNGGIYFNNTTNANSTITMYWNTGGVSRNAFQVEGTSGNTFVMYYANSSGGFGTGAGTVFNFDNQAHLLSFYANAYFNNPTTFISTVLMDSTLTVSGITTLNANVGIGVSPSYNLDVIGTIRSGGEIISTLGSGQGQFRMIDGNYGAMWRNDGTNVYLLSTASGNQYGTYNSFRPFTYNLAAGTLVFDNTAAGSTFVGGVTVDGSINLNAGGTLTAGGYTNVNQIGFLGTPQTIKTANYTFGLADQGQEFLFDTNATTAAIPSNASIAFPIGTVIKISSYLASNQTITITCGDTMYWLPSQTSGSRTLTNRAFAVAQKITATEWWITGVGIT